MKHVKLFEAFVNENWDGKSKEVKLGRVGNFDLIYQTFSKMNQGNGINGTIRTAQNHYVATVDDEGKISFDKWKGTKDPIEVTTKDIDKKGVEKLFNDYKYSFG